jgi:hypothetical protein
MRTYAAFRHGRQVTVNEATRLSFYWLSEMERFASTRTPEERRTVQRYVSGYLSRLAKRARA